MRPLALAACALLAACQPDDADGDTTAVEVRIAVAGATEATRAGNGLLFTGGTLLVSEVEFSADRVGGASVSRSRERIVAYDLATGLPAEGEVAFEVPAGAYADAYLGVELRDEDATPSIVALGTHERSGGEVVPVRFEFNSGEVFEAEGEGIEIAPGATAVSTIRLAPEAWFARVSRERLDGARLDAEGVLVVSEGRNEAIFDLAADGLDVATEVRFD